MVEGFSGVNYFGSKIIVVEFVERGDRLVVDLVGRGENKDIVSFLVLVIE